MSNMHESQRKTCCCCGSSAFGKQWWNRDTGFSVCIRCVERFPNDHTRESVGEPGIHWGTDDKERAEKAALLWTPKQT